MKNWIIKTLLTALAVFFLAWFLDGINIDNGYQTAIMVAIVLGFLNSTLKKVLVVLTLPATILSLGLFLLVINAMVVLSADWLLGAMGINGFHVAGFWSALIFSALLSLISSFLEKIFLPQQTNTRTFVQNSRKTISRDNIHTTVTGNKVSQENGKKTIIIEKD